MKIKEMTSGIRFKTWKYFVLYSLVILVLLIVFQVILLEPYYQSTKARDIRSIVNQIAENISDIDAISEITVNNDGCTLVVNSDGSVQAADAIGVSCLLYREQKVDTEYVDALKQSENGELRIRAEVGREGSQMLIYGKTFFDEEENPYYVLFNTPLQPLKSTISIFRTQYVYITAGVLLASLLISIFVSRRLSQPIIQMKKEAEKMSDGNYEDVRFNSESSFREINELADTLNDTSQKMAQLNELRRDLIANVSHDIRTPLTMIQAYAEMIRDITGDDKQKREANLDIILQETDYMNRLVNDMSEMTKMQSGQVTLNITDFDIGGVIDSIVDKFSTIIHSEGVQIIQEVEPELVAHADKFRITEVIYNLMGNAIKHYGEDKQIIIKAFIVRNTQIRVEVTDHGPGIDAESLSHIWERYYKTDKQYTRAHHGTGLGLAISKAILDRHKAIYGVISKPGEGSTFFFEIPCGQMK